MKQIEGGVTAAKGYTTAGTRAGIKKGKTNKDMAMIFSEKPAVTAGTFTKNLVKAAPVLWDKKVTDAGVAQAVVHAVKRIDPDREVKVVNAEGLQNCKKMLQMAKLGKYNSYLLEGMACPGGCVAGAGTIQTIKKASAALDKMKKEAAFEEASDSKYQSRLESLEKLDLE